MSEELGVFAEPEIISKTLNAHDKKYTDPLEACRAVVEEAYNSWLHFEVKLFI